MAKGIEVKDLRDVAQLRVVVHPHTGAGSAPWPGTDDKQLCYHVMGLVSCRLPLCCQPAYPHSGSAQCVPPVPPSSGHLVDFNPSAQQDMNFVWYNPHHSDVR